MTGIDRTVWPWNMAPPDCSNFDAAVWHATRARGDGELPRQDLEQWITEQRARTNRDALIESVPAPPRVELAALLCAVGEEATAAELPSFVFQAAWAIDHDDRLAGVDRVDAHRRLRLAAEAAERRLRKDDRQDGFDREDADRRVEAIERTLRTVVA